MIAHDAGSQLPCYVFFNDSILIYKGNESNDGRSNYRIPSADELPSSLNITARLPIAIDPGCDETEVLSISRPALDDRKWVMLKLRASYDVLPLASYLTAGKAFQMLYWDRHSRFCPVCGSATLRETSLMKKCPECHHEIYPPIATAIIVRISRGDEILLVRARNFSGSYYGLVAGFVEPGETLEECVEREVREETGLSVSHIRYFASQPWPYPSGLMCGFTARYVGGSLKIQDDELCAGAFFKRDQLPEIPGKLSMARRLIDDWLCGGEETP